MPKLTLRQRLFVLTAVALVPALAILLYNEIALRQTREHELHRNALRIGELAALELQRIIVGVEGILRTIAETPVVRSGETEACRDFLAAIVAQTPQFMAVGVVDANGLLVCRNEMPEAPLSLAARPYFQEVMATGRFVVGDYVTGAISGEGTIPLAVPLRRRDGSVGGAVVAALNTRWLNARVNERSFPPNDALTVADRTGVIIARHPFAERFIGTRIPDTFLHLLQAPQPGTIEVTSQDGTRRVLGYFPVAHAPYGLYVSAGISIQEEMAALNRATQRGLLMVAAGALAAFVLAAATAQRLIRHPVQRLLDTVNGWRSGNAMARTGMRAGDGEMEEVGAAIDAFLDDLAQARLERQKSEDLRLLLTRELEHRIKNTLAMVQALAAQTLGPHVPAESFRDFQGRLAAMGTAYRQLHAEHWRGAALRETVIAALHPFPGDRFRIEGPALRIHAKAAFALSMAVHELATNALKYGALSNAVGHVAIRWTLADDRLVWTWQERGGPPVAPPVAQGFGTRLIERVLAAELRGTVTLRYDAEGLECRLETALAVIGEAAADTAADSEQAGAAAL